MQLVKEIIFLVVHNAREAFFHFCVVAYLGNWTRRPGHTVDILKLYRSWVYATCTDPDPNV